MERKISAVDYRANMKGENSCTLQTMFLPINFVVCTIASYWPDLCIGRIVDAVDYYSDLCVARIVYTVDYKSNASKNTCKVGSIGRDSTGNIIYWRKALFVMHLFPRVLFNRPRHVTYSARARVLWKEQARTLFQY